MRNLKLLQSFDIEIPQHRELPLTATCWDPASSSLLCAFGPSTSDAHVSLRRYQLPQAEKEVDGSDPDDGFIDIASWDAPCPSPGLAHDTVLSLHYFGNVSTAYIVFAGGDIVVVREDCSPGQDKIEILGTVDAGITAAKWSPDEELLAISSRADALLFMTRDLDCVAEVAMTAEDLKASKHVSVGWGKSETQFKGKHAKALRDPTVPEKTDAGLPSPKDQGRTTISWRGDGDYLAISTPDRSKRRTIRVYSREGTMDGVCEPVDGLEGALSWRPAGNLMAGIKRQEDRIDVVFFERNGLRHGQFSLRLSLEDMKSWASDIVLEWNVDSSVLAVLFRDRVQLWTMGNYHYYLKQEVQFHQSPTPVVATSSPWHPESALRLVLPSSDRMVILEYALMVAGGSTIPPNDLGSLAVIDGKNLKVTPLRLANLPPPMAHQEMNVEENIVDVSFNRNGNRIAVLHTEGVNVYEWDPKGKAVPSYHRTYTLLLPTSSPNIRRQQVCIVGDDTVFVLSSDVPGSIINRYTLGHKGQFSLQESSLAPHRVYRLFPTSDHQRVCIQLEGNLVKQGELSEQELHFQTLKRLPTKTPWVEVLRQGNKSMAFGLALNGSLYADERVLVRGCTSFLTTSAHLILTTTSHLLKFIHLADLDDLDVPTDNPEKDERCRSIERGARLIAVMPTSFSLTLQMPRGNLETIYPRALVLAGVRRSIAAKDYKTAFFACRSHRVDLNILHDYAPEEFIRNVRLCIGQIKKVEHIDLFLSQIREEDVSETMYKDTLRSKTESDDSERHEVQDGKEITRSRAHQGSKVNRICDAFLAVLNTCMATNLQNIITAHVCKIPPDLDAGLAVVSKLRQDDPELAEKAVEHICFLVDVNKLYDCALGLYDLELALLDPREYLPYLQGLQEMATLRRRFAIDDGLGRTAKALKHLYDLRASKELKSYAVKNVLFKEALSLYRYQKDELEEVLDLYASYLTSHSRFKEAGLAYEYLSQHKEAMDAYRAAGCWREALSCASQAALPLSQVGELATALADSLSESKDHFHAATIHLDYRQDIEAAVRTFCKGYFFAEAMRIIVLKGRQDLLETAVDQGLVEGLSSSTELLADCRGQINAQFPRLQELRLKKEADPLAFYDGPSTEGDIPDNVSLAETEASTSASLFTRYTNKTGTLNTQTTRRTTKNRRREERKRARGKKGSVYEEEYLVNSIRRLIERVDRTREDIERLVQGCVRRGMRERALAVEGAMVELVGLCQACVEEVFGNGTLVGKDGEEEWKPPGPDGVVQESREQSRKTAEIPVVRPFERLAILGG